MFLNKINRYINFNKKNRHFFIYHHLGLGDHIILNSLVREVIKLNSNENFSIFVKFRNYESVKFMYSDLKNVFFIVIENDSNANLILKFIDKSQLIKIGFENITSDFDVNFYKQLNIEFSKRFDSSILNRDPDTEDKLFRNLNLNDTKYVFIHDDKNREYIIDDNTFIHDKNIKIIRPYLTSTIFDWCKVLENASEIHCICSSFKALVDSLQLSKPKLFYHHTLSNTNSPRNQTYTTSNLPWIKI